MIRETTRTLDPVRILLPVSGLAGRATAEVSWFDPVSASWSRTRRYWVYPVLLFPPAWGRYRVVVRGTMVSPRGLYLGTAPYEARVEVEKALELEPGRPGLNYELGKMLQEMGLASKAAVCLERAAELAPEEPDYQLHYAKSLRQLGRVENAVEVLESAQCSARTPAALHAELADLYSSEDRMAEALEQWDKALTDFSRVLELDPDDIQSMHRLDELYQSAEQWHELLTILEREAELVANPDEVIGFKFRIGALWEEHLDDVARSVEVYREILSVVPDHAETIQALEGIVSGEREPLL